jgi:hypothetical protein
LEVLTNVHHLARCEVLVPAFMKIQVLKEIMPRAFENCVFMEYPEDVNSSETSIITLHSDTYQKTSNSFHCLITFIILTLASHLERMKKTANKYQLQYTSTEVHDGGNKSIR